MQGTTFTIPGVIVFQNWFLTGFFWCHKCSKLEKRLPYIWMPVVNRITQLMLKSISLKYFTLHSLSPILISKYKVQEVSTCWNRLLHIHLVSLFHVDLKAWVLVFVSHQSRCIQLSSTLEITIKWYLLVHLQFFMNYLFRFVKRA